MTNPKKILLTLAGAAAAFTALISFSGKAQAYDEYCREYTRTVSIGNRREEAYGTACLQPDGQWQIVNEGQLRPASYGTYVPNRTVIVKQPTQVVYHERRPTRVVFFGPQRKRHHYVQHHYRHNSYKHHGRGHDHRRDDDRRGRDYRR